MRRGEVRWFTFPSPDKRRPVLMLTRDSAIPLLRDVTVAPITSTIRRTQSQVRLTPDDGMTDDCVVNLFQIQTVPAEEIGPVITCLGDARMDQVRLALLYALGFESHGEISLAEVTTLWPDPEPAPSKPRRTRARAARSSP